MVYSLDHVIYVQPLVKAMYNAPALDNSAIHASYLYVCIKRILNSTEDITVLKQRYTVYSTIFHVLQGLAYLHRIEFQKYITFELYCILLVLLRADDMTIQYHTLGHVSRCLTWPFSVWRYIT
jgi:hypothetical protein